MKSPSLIIPVCVFFLFILKKQREIFASRYNCDFSYLFAIKKTKIVSLYIIFIIKKGIWSRCFWGSQDEVWRDQEEEKSTLSHLFHQRWEDHRRRENRYIIDEIETKVWRKLSIKLNHIVKKIVKLPKNCQNGQKDFFKIEHILKGVGQ